MHSGNFVSGTAPRYSSQPRNNDHGNGNSVSNNNSTNSTQHQEYILPPPHQQTIPLQPPQQSHPHPHPQLLPQSRIPASNNRQSQQQQQKTAHPARDIADGLDTNRYGSTPHVSIPYQPSTGQHASAGSSYMFNTGSATNNMSSISNSLDIPNHLNVYPSTLLPSRHINTRNYHLPPSHPSPIPQQQQQQQQHQHRHPIKFLQSCDSCRRRKIRCSGEKPVCSSCIRYQELCHYSPLATPRRRAGKRARMNKDIDSETSTVHKTNGNVVATSSDRAGSDEPLAPSGSAQNATREPVVTATGDEQAASDRAGETVSLRNVDKDADVSDRRYWQSEANELRSGISTLSHKFDSISNKLDRLMRIIDKRRRRHNNIEESDEEEYGLSEETPESESENRHEVGGGGGGVSGIEGIYRDFSNLVDKTSRFNIDSTNVGNISEMIRNIDRQLYEQQSIGINSSSNSNSYGDDGGVGFIEGDPVFQEKQRFANAIQQLDTLEMQDHLVDVFYLNTDINTISFIPRYIFHMLQQNKRTPTSMLNLMKADACRYSSHEAVIALGRSITRGIFIERAYKALFECLEYDSVEHCVSLLLFAMVISKAGLHRAWIMQSLSTQMAIRLRFNTLDSPLSALAFRNDSEEIREWKRRVFWQLYSFELLTTTLGDLPPCLSIHDIRCNPPQPLTEELVSSDDEKSKAMAALGPALIFCEDQSTIGLQIELMRIMCDISSLQNKMTPEESLFPPNFMEIHGRLVEWRKRMPHFDVLIDGSMEQVSAVFKFQPGLIVLGLLCQYSQIFLCLIKDTWLPSTRAMTTEETKTLEWARNTAYESAQAIHRLVPFVQGMRLNTVSPFVSCVVFQACIVSVHSCGWKKRDPRRILNAVHHVQRGLEFLEYVSPRWGFASIMTTSLRSLIVERGFGATEAQISGLPNDVSMESGDGNSNDDDDLHERNPGLTVAGERVVHREGMALNNGELPELSDNGNDASRNGGGGEEGASGGASVQADIMRPFQEEAHWERILRTGGLSSLDLEAKHMRGPCTRMADACHQSPLEYAEHEPSQVQDLLYSSDANNTPAISDLVHDYNIGEQQNQGAL
ncbi:hypothetical protein GGI11_002174 [Coemansia sp. RSA 2049]|nr:hypothetical protein GGI11_002174 [Coemansia sp. RSA 2049]